MQHKLENGVLCIYVEMISWLCSLPVVIHLLFNPSLIFDHAIVLYIYFFAFQTFLYC